MARTLRGNSRWLAATLALAVSIGVPAACAPGAPQATSVDASLGAGEGELVVESGTQVVVGELRIGAGNIVEEEYVADGGTTTSGLTAGLWFSTDEAPADPPHVRVHPGQVVEVEGIQVRVLAVEPTLVRLTVIQAPS